MSSLIKSDDVDLILLKVINVAAGCRMCDTFCLLTHTLFLWSIVQTHVCPSMLQKAFMVSAVGSPNKHARSVQRESKQGRSDKGEQEAGRRSVLTTASLETETDMTSLSEPSQLLQFNRIHSRHTNKQTYS